jgi:hypothetical protein
MTNVKWLDEVALSRQVLSGDQEAFSELMRRFDPVVRSRLRNESGEARDEEIAAFWCRRLGDIGSWNPDEGLLLAQWLRRAS